jgi:NDP-sugar pyrophosphorylase family protein
VLARRTRLHSYSLVENSVLFDNVEVGRHCTIRNAIIDKNVVVPEGTEIGVTSRPTARAASRSRPRGGGDPEELRVPLTGAGASRASARRGPRIGRRRPRDPTRL